MALSCPVDLDVVRLRREMAELVQALTDAGLSGVRVTHRFDCFAGTSKERIARKYGVAGVTVAAERGS